LMAGNVFNQASAPDTLMDAVLSVVLIIIVLSFFAFFLTGALNVLWKTVKKSKWGKQRAWVRGDKRIKKSKKLSMRQMFNEMYSLDRRSLRRANVPKRRGEVEVDKDVNYTRNVLFMSDSLSGGNVMYDDVEKTDIAVMVNPLVLQQVAAAVEEERKKQEEKRADEARKRREAEEKIARDRAEDEARQEEADRRYRQAVADAETKKEVFLASQLQQNLHELELQRKTQGPRFEALDPILIAAPDAAAEAPATATIDAAAPRTQRGPSDVSAVELAALGVGTAAAPGSSTASASATAGASGTDSAPADSSAGATPTAAAPATRERSPTSAPVVDIARAAVRHEFAPTKTTRKARKDVDD